MISNRKPIATLHDLLDHNAQKFIPGEIELKTSLMEWKLIPDSLKLKSVLEKYLVITQDHIRDLENFYAEEKISLLNLANKTMLAFIDETNEKLTDCADPRVKDACLLASVQLINHYKISTYGTAAAYARELGMESWATVFHKAEVDEKQIDDRLSQLAEHEINNRARTPLVIET